MRRWDNASWEGGADRRRRMVYREREYTLNAYSFRVHPPNTQCLAAPSSSNCAFVTRKFALDS